MSERPFRVGLQLRASDPAEAAEEAQRAEELGFDIVLVADHVGSDHSPLLMLAAAAHATQRVRLGTYVLNCCLHHPVMLARDVVTLDHLSGGRVELGLGAGHTPAEFAATGVPMQPARQRKERLAEFVEIMRTLLDGGTVDHNSDRFDLAGAANVTRSRQERLPILVGGSGEALLSHAGTHADIVGFTGLGTTQADGHHHSVRMSDDVMDAEVAVVREATRSDSVEAELNVLVQVVDVTDDRVTAAEALAVEIEGLTVDDALVTPFLALGTPDEIAEQLRVARERWAINYFVVRDAEGFAPVIERLRSPR
ncbi:MAG: TIGR03621 family F420-dependent LLM class oxidoreductase [Actinomycetota bacterium]|nr:TIGR03621 family F420-dependent LLM class oxidoreductase [Actinomycetota bacterium]